MSVRIIFKSCITKHVGFCLPAHALDCCWFQKKNKKIQLCFSLLVFSSPSLTFLKIGQHFFIYLVALTNFSRNLSNVFFISSPSLTFPKISSMVIFLKCFDFSPSLIRFWIISDLKQFCSVHLCLYHSHSWDEIVMLIFAQFSSVYVIVTTEMRIYRHFQNKMKSE